MENSMAIDVVSVCAGSARREVIADVLVPEGWPESNSASNAERALDDPPDGSDAAPFSDAMSVFACSIWFAASACIWASWDCSDSCGSGICAGGRAAPLSFFW